MSVDTEAGFDHIELIKFNPIHPSYGSPSQLSVFACVMSEVRKAQCMLEVCVGVCGFRA